VDAFVCDLITCSDTFANANVNLKK
jgi:hypothetical protein